MVKLGINKKILFLSILFFVGFFLRFFGLFYMGNHNYDTYKEWGVGVRNDGLAEAYKGGYGPIAYLIMGGADYIGSFSPKIWWWPYKGANLIFEILILFLFFRLLPKNKFTVTFMYWLNPWFLIPSAWQGFWDAGFAFFILITVMALEKTVGKEKANFFVPGLLFGIAACVKPQVIAPISALGIVFFLNYFLRRKFKEIFQFALGFFILPTFFDLYFLLYAKGLFYFYKIYAGFMLYMPYLVASEINIWHTVTRIIMYFNNMSGPIYSVSTLTFPYNFLEKGAYLFYFTILIYFIYRANKNHLQKTSLYFTKLFALPFIMMPQILTRSHAYHFYPATLLLIPIIIIYRDRKMFFLWFISVFCHFYNIYLQYRWGRTITTAFIPIWDEPYLSILGFIQFLATISIIYIFLTKYTKSHLRS